MGKEHDLIKMISSIMPRSQHQLNQLFESDAEIIDFGGKRMLFNIDEFSQEDHFREDDPFSLGWNLAVGTLSDILATGGRPLFYAHSMVTSEKWDRDFIKSFSQGVAAVLEKSQVSFIGGDLGKSPVWQYTAAVIGVLEGKPILRSGAKAGDVIYISGKIGAGNLEAFLKISSEKKRTGRLAKLIKTRFPLRIGEAELIRKYATSCIDTSDGVFNALNTISEMSGTGYEVSDLPYLKTGELASKIFSIPKTLLFLGECGEYELLFTVCPQDEEFFFLKEAQSKGWEFTKIGRITESSKRVLHEDQKTFELSPLNIRARDFDQIKTYIKTLIDFIKDGS